MNSLNRKLIGREAIDQVLNGTLYIIILTVV